MTSVTDPGILTTCFLFQDLPPETCQDVLARGYQKRVDKGSYFFHQGEAALTMYVLHSGRVKLVQVTPAGEQVIVNYLGPGEGLGIIVALSHMTFPLSAEAIEPCLAIGWDQATMLQLMHQYPQLALNGLEMIGRRFARLQARNQDLATQQVEQRIARTLLRLVRQFGRRVPEGVLIDMPLSREDLAQMTGTNLYNVSRIMSKWEQAGLVSSGRMRVVLCKAHEMVIIAGDTALPGPGATDEAAG
ncbi:MAG: Crp/Fnr family transcriptional regulator [Anaerolineales bacterium]|nr:Crp/Fnr family transcriptional regulator [Anaerolineales bacterium]